MAQCNCDNSNQQYTDVKALPLGELNYVIGIGSNGELQLGAAPNFENYLPLAGGTMQGALTLYGNPQKDFDAATKKYVDDNIRQVVNQTLTFKGYVSATAPSSADLTLNVGDIWYQSTTMPGTFPISVSVWEGSKWNAGTSFTASNLDLFTNLSDNSGWYWFGGKWNQLDYGTDAFDPNQFAVVNGKLSIKQNAITDKEVADGAGIQPSKILNLVPNLADLQNQIDAVKQQPITQAYRQNYQTEVLLTPTQKLRITIHALDLASFDVKISAWGLWANKAVMGVIEKYSVPYLNSVKVSVAFGALPDSIYIGNPGIINDDTGTMVCSFEVYYRDTGADAWILLDVETYRTGKVTFEKEMIGMTDEDSAYRGKSNLDEM